MAQTKTKSPFAGNGLSRTAMLFRIATMAGHRLTVPELNRIRDINPRQLERTYEAVVGGGRNDQGRRPVCPAADTEVRRAWKSPRNTWKTFHEVKGCTFYEVKATTFHEVKASRPHIGITE